MKTNIEKLTLSNRSLTALALLALLAGCGGGGGDDGAAPAPAVAVVPDTPAPDPTPDPDPEPEPEPEPTPDPTSLDDLVVDADNAMQAAYMLTINVDMSSQSRGYFSLCDDYTTEGSSYNVNFDSCLFRGPLSDGKLSKQLKIANHESQLVAVIWFYEGQNPQYAEWRYISDNEQQVLTMN